MDDFKTKLTLVFIFWILFTGIFTYIFAGYVPRLLSTEYDGVSDTGNVLTAGQAFFKLMTFQINTSETIFMGLIMDSWLLIGLFLLLSFLFGR